MLVVATLSVSAALPAAAVAALLPSGASVTQLYVGTLTDDPSATTPAADCADQSNTDCTLRDAVATADQASGTYTINIPSGTITLEGGASSGSLAVPSGVAITFQGAGQSKTVIYAHDDTSSNPDYRLLNVNTGATAVINNMSIYGDTAADSAFGGISATSGYGGAIFNDGTLVVNSSLLSSTSSAFQGGAIAQDIASKTATEPSTTITDSTLTGNKATNAGGAIGLYAGSLTLNGDQITDNYAPGGGGAIYDYEGTSAYYGGVTIGEDASGTGTTFDNNYSDGYNGGAIDAYNGSQIDYGENFSITGATFSNNSNTGSTVAAGAVPDGAAIGGGALAGEGGTWVVKDSTFLDNVSLGYGGAIDEAAGDWTFDGDTFSGNHGTFGGAVSEFDATNQGFQNSITNSVFTADNALPSYGGDSYGGALAIELGSDSPMLVEGNTFQNNEANQGGAIIDLSSSGLVLQGNLIGGDDSSGKPAGNIGDTYGGGFLYDTSSGLQSVGNTFADNQALQGGGMYVNGVRFSSQNDTFDSNAATSTSGIGGGVVLDVTGNSSTPLTFDNDTIANNTAGSAGGGIYQPWGANAFANTIVADNTANGGQGYGDCDGNVNYNGASNDQGGNLDSDGTCLTSSSGAKLVSSDLPKTNPQLSPLALNTPATLVPTDALSSTSPAIGLGLGQNCPATDERGAARPSGICDAGAYDTGTAKLGGGGTTTTGTTTTGTTTTGTTTTGTTTTAPAADPPGSGTVTVQTSGPAGQTITVTAAAPAPAPAVVPVSYKWSFGDGSAPFTSTMSAHATHTYKVPGVYKVTSVITFSNGTTLATTKTVTVGAKFVLPFLRGRFLTHGLHGEVDIRRRSAIWLNRNHQVQGWVKAYLVGKTTHVRRTFTLAIYVNHKLVAHGTVTAANNVSTLFSVKAPKSVAFTKGTKVSVRGVYKAAGTNHLTQDSIRG